MKITNHLSRRLFIRSAGVSLALPILESAGFGLPKSPETKISRMICINTSLGLHTPNLFPSKTGFEYETTPYLEQINDFRKSFTVFSGLSHPEVDGGHPTELCYLTAAPHPRADNFKNTISLDQFAVEKINPQTRIPSLVLSSDSSRGISFTRGGVPIPAESRPSRIYREMFVNGSPTEVKSQLQKLQQGQSIMDTVLEEAKKFQKSLGKQDQEKLSEYFSAVREVEIRMTKAQEWVQKPKPKVDMKPPVDIQSSLEISARVRLMIDMIHLALQTDTTRFITFALNGLNAVPVISGVTQDWHNLSHHGQDPSKLSELRIIEIEQMRLFGELLKKLKGTTENGYSLLDSTTVMFGSNLGNASSHDNKNMPIIIAGGPFKHSQHIAFDPRKNPPLCNLYVTMLQGLGVETDKFGSSTGTINGLELSKNS